MLFGSVGFLQTSNKDFEIEESKKLNQDSSNRYTLSINSKQMENTFTMQPMGVFVGELQESWNFPSDHLPIAMQFGDLHIASWNVLDSKYMDWVIEKNHQGLARSVICDEHIYIENSDLTVRDKHTARLVVEMALNTKSGEDIIALQECNSAFITELKSQLPDHYRIIQSHGEALVLNMNVFDVVFAKTVEGIFSENRKKSVQSATLQNRNSGEILHIINAHLPGDPLKPARFEFAEYLVKLQLLHSQEVIIAMGDMNFNELEMKDSFIKANSESWQQFSPYCTNISPYTFISKDIDHFFVFDKANRMIHLQTNPKQIMSELQDVHALLQGSKTKPSMLVEK